MKIFNVRNSVKAYYLARKWPKLLLRGKLLDLLLEDNSNAQSLIRYNYSKMYQWQRLAIIRSFSDFYAYQVLRDVRMNMHERTLAVNIMLYGKCKDHFFKNEKWMYIRNIVDSGVELSPYEISKFTDYLVENKILEYIPQFYYKINFCYADPVYFDTYWWDNYDIPKLEPYVIAAKLI